MQKLYTLLFSAFFFTASAAFAHSGIDSIGVENNKGKKVILYQVEAKDTYYSISKKYNVLYKEVMEFNDSKLLQPGVVLKVPTQLPFGNATPASNSAAPVDAALTTYTVKAKDNLNLIATKFGTTVDEIKRVNGLTSISLQIGQLLKIPGAETSNIAAANTRATSAPETRETPPARQPVTEPAQPIIRHYKAKISHKVKSGENLGAIAEKYDTTVEAIKKLNKLTKTNLKIGQVLKVEVKRTETIRPRTTPVERAPQTVNAANHTTENTPTAASGFEHTVVAGETIYSIARKYNLTTYQLKTANNLSDNELKTGQKLLIKGVTLASTAANTGTTAADEDDDDSEVQTIRDPRLRQPASKFGLVRFDEKGTAVWIADQDLDPTKMLVLHRTAPVGTIIQLTNPMTNRSAFAKVVGKFTENETTKDVIIVMTKAVADAVGALDKRFFCTINYGAVENEQQ